MQKGILTFLFLAFVNTLVSAEEPLTWQTVFQMIDEHFPNTPEITVAELVRLQRDNVAIYLIDARSKKEYQVSHIKGAVNLTSTTQVQTEVRNKKTLIIVYCSVGWRSADLVTNLRAEGYHNSFNLKGSIFEWANSGQKVYKNNEKETHLVHPFNKKWGVLLEKQYHYKSWWNWW